MHMDLRTPARLAAAGLVGAAAAWQVAHRTSPAVRGWSPPARTAVLGGPLAATMTDDVPGAPVVLLLHGITASGVSFGADYDDLPATVLVPDLLGFGRSMDLPTPGYSVADHTDAVVQTIRTAGLADRPTLVVGHSMGAVLALHVAAAIPDPIGVVAMSAPLYDTEDEALDHIGGADPLAGLLAVGDLAERVCGWMCAHRELALALWPLLAPRWPRPVAQDGVLHTWTSYRGSLQSLVLDSGYTDALDRLRTTDVPLLLLDGGDDGVPVDGRAASLADRAGVQSVTVEGADHALPLSHAGRCVETIADSLQRWS